MRLLFFLSILITPLSLRANGGLTFEPNAGQTSSDIRYIARASNHVFFVTDHSILLIGAGQSVPVFELPGADLGSQWQPEAATGQTISYFIGRDPSKWIEDLPRYERLIRRNVYPGIDLLLHGSEDQLEYDFELAPHADLSQIRLQLAGAQRISLAPDGTLVVDTAAGKLRHRAPVLTETLPDGSRQDIAGRFQMLGANEIGFALDGHDSALALSIDPVLESSTYFGGHGDDQVIGTDGHGTLVGNTTSIDVPGAQFARRAGTALFVRTASQTFIVGCSGNVTAVSASFQPSGQVLAAIGGYTDCADLPTNLGNRLGFTASALQPNYAGGATDGFLFLVLSNPSSLVPGINLTYIGGPGDDRVNAVAQTPSGYLALAGSTTSGGLPEPSLFPCAANTAPSGGSDAFLMLTYNAQVGYPVSVNCTEYLGGSGDDRALGVAAYGSFVYVTGETRSPNFPLIKPLYSKRQGDSDAFIASFLLDGTLVASTLFGGSGSDQAVAATTTSNGNIVVAGVTSSTDLPLKNPTQKTYGGGESDAFVAQFSPDLSTLVSSTYVGGSSADEATSIARSYPNTIFVGGWTASHDFPTVNALQKSYGGGPDDGFLVHYDDDGSIYQATFFGGSGSDRILGVTGSYAIQQSAPFGPTVWLAGTTTSPDLKLQNPIQANLAGPSDGFIAEVTADLATMAPFSGGQDLRGIALIYFGDPQLAGKTKFTISSSEPSIVALATDQTTPGASPIEIGPDFSGVSGRFYVDCLTSSGDAELTITAPGFKTKKIPVQCYPAAIWLFPFGTQNEIFTSLGGNYPVAVGFTLGPQNGNFVAGSLPRPGATPPTIEISTSNPSVGTLSASSLTLNSIPLGITFTPLAIGSTELTFNAGAIPILPSNTLKMTVGGSYGPPGNYNVPAGFQGLLNLFQNSGTTAKIPTITSGDPSRLLVSLDPLKTGSKSVTLSPGSGAPSVWVQAVGSSGTVPLKISVSGEPDINYTINITTPLLALDYGTNTGQSLELPVGGVATISAAVQATYPNLTQLRRNPSNSAIQVTLDSSNLGVVSISPSTAEIAPGSDAFVSFKVVGTAAGSTVLTTTNSSKIGTGKTFASAIVNVGTRGILFPTLDLGNNLAAPMMLTLPAPAITDIGLTVSVSDPTLALLSLDGTSPGLPQITTFISGGQSTLQFYVYGLAAAGQVTITATPAGIGPLTSTVNLHPSGFYWDTDNIDYTLGSGPIFLGIDVGPIDTASGFPLGTQALSPGISGTLGIANTNAKVMTLNSSEVPIPVGTLSPTPIAQGSATLTLKQPNGFTAASVRQQLTVSVTGASSGLSIIGGRLGKNTQTQLSIFALGSTFTVTSSDPSKVLLSTDTSKLGSRSIKVQQQWVYAQALAASGTVTITVSAPNYAPASAVFTLVPTGFGITLYATGNAVNFQNGKYTTTTLSDAVTVVVNLYLGPNQGAGTLLPGLKPITANILSSNTGVAVLTGTPVTIPAKQPYSGQGLAQATLLQVSPGETTISISQPPGFSSVGANSLTLDVVTPALNAGNPIAIAKDCMSASGVGLPQSIKPLTASLPVTLTSSDPSRVLLSPDTTTTPAPSITVTIPPGSYGAAFYIHALANDGTVSINAHASGFADASTSVQLFPLAFEFFQAPNSPTQAIIQAGPQHLQVAALPLIPSGSNLGFTLPNLRPGVPPIVVTVTSSDASTVSVNPGQLVFQGTLSTPSVAYTPKKPGTATLKLSVPNGYQVVPSQGQLTVIASEAGFVISNYPAGSGPEIGDNLELPINLSVQAGQINMPVTITSSDPSSLVISTDGTVLGKGSITLPASQAQSPMVFLQSLAASGNPTVKFESSGYQTTLLPVTLVQAAAVFQAQGTQEVLTNAGVIQQAIILVPLDLARGAQSARPGANLSVAVTSSDPTVLAITTPTVQIPVQLTNAAPASVGIQPISTGTAVVTLGPLAGNPTPPNGNDLTFNVAQPELVLPAISVGIDLQVPVQIQLGSSIPTPQSDLTVTVGPSPAQILMAQNPGDRGQNSISVTIPAGQRSSQTFYIQGLAIGSGTLPYGGGSFGSYSTPVTVTETAFIIQEAVNGQPLNIRDDGSASLTVVPSLSPETNTPTGPLSVRGGANPITIAVASTNPVVAAVTSEVIFNPGDQKQMFGVHGASPGHATVKLLGTNYDFSQPQASIQVNVK